MQMCPEICLAVPTVSQIKLDVYYLRKKICNVKCEMMCLFSLNFLEMLSARKWKDLYTTPWFCIMPMP
jgi:hypothetical protein